ncbi:MAG: hypothetical protein WAN22_03470 [Solirubrobacteraceae bacterium]
MFKSVKRLLIAATAVLALSASSVAYARVDPGGSSTSGQARPSVAQLRTAAQLRRLDVVQATVAQRFASKDRGPSTASRASDPSGVHPAGPSAQAGFQWDDAGIGAAGVLALVGVGAGVTVVIRRRVREPLAN